jgi:tRNA A37 methylthiotransferase MiaB
MVSSVLNRLLLVEVALKISMISLGCPKNLVDSEVMLGLAQQGGHELTRTPATPTC